MATLAQVACEFFEHQHIWCEYEDNLGTHTQCVVCGEECKHTNVEAVITETQACRGAYGYYEPPEEVTEWHCRECGSIVPPPPVEPVTDDDDLPF